MPSETLPSEGEPLLVVACPEMYSPEDVFALKFVTDPGAAGDSPTARYAAAVQTPLSMVYCCCRAASSGVMGVLAHPLSTNTQIKQKDLAYIAPPAPVVERPRYSAILRRRCARRN